jgi:hypothetical protein
MFAIDNSQVRSVAIGLVVFGVLLIASAIAIAVTLVDWKAIKERRAQRMKLRDTHADAEQGG